MYLNHRSSFGCLREEAHEIVQRSIQAEMSPLSVIKNHNEALHEKIVREWGTKELNAALNRMILNQSNDARRFGGSERRRQPRSPFPGNVAMAILSVLNAHERKFGFTS